MSVELCLWLVDGGASVQAHDPAVKSLPDELRPKFRIHANVEDALKEADAVVMATEWPEYSNIQGDLLVSGMKTPIVLDPGRSLAKSLGADPRIRYITVGKPTS
jgi:UDPglucose 6-dehydrogenase